ncbi:MAG: rhomboid family intramembrane serine protease [Oscillospiraceae bacterium]|nr:rhomboid family intramembrane serine protease [Oscillospiraceae bacterium]
MKALNKAIDKFCLKHRRFGIPRLMLYIVIVSAVVYLIDWMDTTGQLLPLLAFSPGRILGGEVWRLITWVFCPLRDNIFLTAIMLYFYYFIGSSLEREWGTAKFTLYYLSGVLFNIIFGFLIYYAFGGPAVLGAKSLIWLSPTYLNLSMFFAFASLFPEQRVMLFFIIPVKIKWLALVDAVLFVYTIISGFVTGLIIEALLPIVALLNFVIICGYDVITMLRPLRARASPGAINFKSAAKQAKRDQESKDYRHKCSVCGRTDTGNPELEFRYCSRCNGYHCFCSEHINSHVHFK